MASFQVLRNRLTNGKPYTVAAALERITALSDNLEITEQEAAELTALAREYGSAKALTVEARLDALEAKALELETRDLEHDEAIMELGAMVTGTE